MASMKEEWMEQQENKKNIKLAKYLGITPDELDETDFYIDEEIGSEGAVLNNLLVFTEIPDSIAKKIKGLNGNTIIIDFNEI